MRPDLLARTGDWMVESFATLGSKPSFRRQPFLVGASV